MSAKRRKHRPASPANTLQARARRGFRGYPIATIAYYGPDNMFASKVAVGIILEEDGEAAFLERWFSDDLDVRRDPGINQKIVAFIGQHKVKSVIVTDGIIGCPHEEGIDYPLGESCPQCPYWAGRDRWIGELVGEDGEPVSEVTTVTGCAWYRADQWERLREMSVDRDGLERTHEEWLAGAQDAVSKMRKTGIDVEKVDVDVENLLAWCRAEGCEVDSAARALYVAETLRRRDEGENGEP